MEAKLKVLKRYSSYFFVVNNQELRKHEEFGEVVLRSSVPTKLRNFFG
jgi:hypothetical protein